MNNNEILKILSMIESEKITAKEGNSLLSALKKESLNDWKVYYKYPTQF